MTHSDKTTMYMKLTKGELTEMLINANEATARAQQTRVCAACHGEGGHNRGYGWSPCDACDGKGY